MERVQALVRSDRRLTVRMIPSELHFKQSMFHQKFRQELAVRKFCGQIFAKKLTNEKKDNWKDLYLHFLERIPSERNIFKNVFRSEETWILEYDPKTKKQSNEWQTSASPCPKKPE